MLKGLASQQSGMNSIISGLSLLGLFQTQIQIMQLQSESGHMQRHQPLESTNHTSRPYHLTPSCQRENIYDICRALETSACMKADRRSTASKGHLRYRSTNRHNPHEPGRSADLKTRYVNGGRQGQFSAGRTRSK